MAASEILIMHLEFAVLGPPVSNQSPGPNLASWRASIRSAAENHWKESPLTGPLKAILINFHQDEKPSLDVDNMSKPVLDTMEAVVYEDDRQIRQVEITHVRIDAPFIIVGVSKVVVSYLQAGNQFLYVRIEDPVEPFPLPK